MFILTITTATVEIIAGVHSHSNSLIADGLYSFAEGLCLIGVILILRYSENDKNPQEITKYICKNFERLFLKYSNCGLEILL